MLIALFFEKKLKKVLDFDFIMSKFEIVLI